MKRLNLLIIALLLPQLCRAATLMCPDGGDETHRREAMATSAPEIKVSAAAQDDAARWAKVLRPLTAKAVKQAKAQRAVNIEEGVEHGCNPPQIYVAQLMSDPTTGCSHHAVTRPGNENQLYVQVVAVCQYTWSCCTASGGASAASNGYSLEGPVTTMPKTAATAPSPTTTSKSTGSADNVSAAPSASAPVKPINH